MKRILKYGGVWLKRIGGFLLIFVLLLSGLLHSVWFQSAAGRYAGDFCSRWSGLDVQVGQLQFSLFKKAVRVCDFRVSDTKGQPMVEAESVYLAFSNYVFKGVDIAVLSVRRPRIHIIRPSADSVSDFKALLQQLGTLKKNKDKRSVTSIRRLRVEEGLFVYDNRAVPVRADGRIDFKHIEVPVFNAHIRNLHIFNQHICARVQSLSAREKCGLDVRHLTGWVGFFPDRLVVRDLDLETAYSHIKGQLQFGYGHPRAFRHFAESVAISANVAKGSRLATQDLGYFATPLQAYRQTVMLSGRVNGPLKDICVRDLNVRFGQTGRLSADIHWRGFPMLRDSGDIDLQLKDLNVTRQDLLGIEDFATGRLSLPSALADLEQAALQGDFKGNLVKFTTRLALRTNLGDVTVDVRSQDSSASQMKGTVTASELNVGLLTGRSDMFGTVDADLQVEVMGTHIDEMRYALDGRLFNLSLKGRPMDTVLLNGQLRKNYFHGSVIGTDSALDFTFDGLLDYEQEEPVSRYALEARKIDLQALGFVADKQPFTLSGEVSTDYVGYGLDDLLGNFDVQQLQVERHGYTFYLPGLRLTTHETDSLHKTTEVTSDFLQLTLGGHYTISRLPSLYKDVLHAYLPGLTAKAARPAQDAQAFDLNLVLSAYRYDGQVYGINRLLELFVPALQLDDNTRLSLHYDAAAPACDLRLDSRYIGFKNILFTDGSVRLKTDAVTHTRMAASVTASTIYLNDSLSLHNFQTEVALDSGHRIDWRLGWLNAPDSLGHARSSGYWAATVDLSDMQVLRMRFDSSYFVFAGHPWQIYPDASWLWRKGEMRFENIGLRALQTAESVLLNGRWAADTAATLNLAFRSFDMAYLSPFTRQAGMEVAGTINGSLQVRDPKQSFNLMSDIALEGLALNGGAYGKGQLKAVFNRESRRINGQLTIGPDTVPYPLLSVSGYYDLANKSMDFKGKMKNLPVHFLSGYLRSFASDLAGDMDGTLRISGPVKQMKWDLQGESRNIAMTVKILQTRYQFSNFALRLTENEIRFNNSRMRDIQYGTQGRMGGLIRHRYFKDMALELRLDFENFLVLNTKPSKEMLYSGRVFATGRVDITGPTNELSIAVKGRTEEDSHIDFDLSSTSGASSSNFIRFESERPVDIDPLKAFYARHRQKERQRGGHLTVELALEVTPDLEVGLDIRNTTINGLLDATGEGNLRLLVDSRGTQLFGTYRILAGMFDFSMMDLINKRFKLKEGGSIVWTGPVTDARVDVEAVYTARTSLYPVLASAGSSLIDESNLRKKVGVESIIELDGNLLNPDIHFDINLPNVEADIQDLFFSYVNKEDEDEMIRQTFSLLMFNSFMSVGNDQGGAMAGNNALVSSSELLFNQFNNFLSRLSTNFNVGMNYTPASEMNESELQVMLSGQLFDDRLSIDGNIGVSEVEAKAAASVVGDVNIEWKFTEQLRLKAFNRSNEKSLNQPDNTYTQGLGVIFRRDFNTGKELFSRIGPTKEERVKRRQERKARKQAEKK